MDINRNAPATASAENLVHAPLEVVWAVQTGLMEWPLWNPDVTRMDMQGSLVPGAEFRWKAGGASIRSTLREVEPRRRIVWTGRTMGIDAIHVWNFTEESRGVRVRTEESFDGWIVRLFRSQMRRMLLTSLENGLAALKRESERRAAHQS